MARFALHAVLALASLLLAVVCLGRAWMHGRSGLNEYSGFANDIFEYQKVVVWAIAGAVVLAFALINVLFLFDPAPPAIR